MSTLSAKVLSNSFCLLSRKGSTPNETNLLIWGAKPFSVLIGDPFSEGAGCGVTEIGNHDSCRLCQKCGRRRHERDVGNSLIITKTYL